MAVITQQISSILIEKTYYRNFDSFKWNYKTLLNKIFELYKVLFDSMDIVKERTQAVPITNKHDEISTVFCQHCS